MSEVSDMLQRYREIHLRLRYPPNAVPDTGINLKRKVESIEPKQLLIETPAPPSTDRASYAPFVSIGITFSSTVEITAKEFGIPVENLYVKTRIRAVCYPRQVAIYVATKQERWTASWIAHRLDLDHSTVLHAKRKIAELMETDPDLKERVQSIETALEARNRPALPNLSEQHLAQGSEGILPQRPVLEMDSGSRSTLRDGQGRTPADH